MPSARLQEDKPGQNQPNCNSQQDPTRTPVRASGPPSARWLDAATPTEGASVRASGRSATEADPTSASSAVSPVSSGEFVAECATPGSTAVNSGFAGPDAVGFGSAGSGPSGSGKLDSSGGGDVTSGGVGVEVPSVSTASNVVSPVELVRSKPTGAVCPSARGRSNFGQSVAVPSSSNHRCSKLAIKPWLW